VGSIVVSFLHRSREDTAKYLHNLDTESAYYDPKSRSMRDNPHASTGVDPSQVSFAGDNFARVSGDTVELANTQLFAWEAESKGLSQVHPQANPSQAELLRKEFKSKSTDLQLAKQRAVLEKYGGAEYLDGPDGLASAAKKWLPSTGSTPVDSGIAGRKQQGPAAGPPAVDRQVRFGVSTQLVEYSRDGRLHKVSGKTVVRETTHRVPIVSKYEEDLFTNGHRTVWGSYFHKGAFSWGYEDDHSLLRNSYCTGEAGREANDEAHALQYGTGEVGSAELAQARALLSKQPLGTKKDTSLGTSSMLQRSKLYGEANPTPDLDEAKLREALQRQAQEKNDAAEADDRKRKYHSMNAEVNVTEEDMEAYRLAKGT
jgi:pre-mRNA-processing factor SLU7